MPGSQSVTWELHNEVSICLGHLNFLHIESNEDIIIYTTMKIELDNEMLCSAFVLTAHVSPDHNEVTLRNTLFTFTIGRIPLDGDITTFAFTSSSRVPVPAL